MLPLIEVADDAADELGDAAFLLGQDKFTASCRSTRCCRSTAIPAKVT
jgi:hypothetical protein